MSARAFPVVVVLFAGALFGSFGCGGGSDSGGNPFPPLFSCGDAGSPGVNTAAMRCAGPSGRTGAQVNFVIRGPAMGSTTVDGFNFDITYDPAKIQFVQASSSANPPFSAALVAVALANGQQGRVVVSIQQPGGANAIVLPGQHAILTLSFRGVTGVTFGPTPLTFENAEATNPSTTINFVSGLTLAYQ